jgi:hypothetical protein
LARQVYLERGIDGGHAVVLGDYQRIIGVADPLEFDRGIVVDEFIGLFPAHAEGGHGLSAVDVLPGIVNVAIYNEVDH